MRVLPLAIACALVALPACAAMPADGEATSISYETGPCFGACPVYKVTVNANGAGLFEGRRFTSVTGERRFSITPAQFLVYAVHLAPLRPTSGDLRYSGPPLCQRMATDLPSAEVTWRSGNGERRLYFYYGCDMERNRAIAERLTAAPGLLPIGDFIRAPR